MVSSDILNAFTVDVEDYYQVSAFEGRVARQRWDDYESRVVASTEALLRLLDRHQVRATFFVLGWVARRYPSLVRTIQREGHEIGSHGFWHRLVYEQTPEEFRADLVASRQALEDATGDPVRSYRAPSFSITGQSLWALEILVQEGFACDSSVYPVYHDRYGIPGAQRFLHRLSTPAGELWEFPAATVRFGGTNVPVSGGGYFRLYPFFLTRRWLAQINAASGQPFVFYTHPWEIDPDQPRLRVAGLPSRFRHYVNLAKTAAKLERLLAEFRFGRLCDVVCAAQREAVCPA